MDAILASHIAAVAFWFGLVGAEFVIERSRTESQSHGFAVARNHYYIDLFLKCRRSLSCWLRDYPIGGDHSYQPANGKSGCRSHCGYLKFYLPLPSYQTKTCGR